MAAFNEIQNQRLLDGLSQGILIFDSDNRLVHNNQAAEQILEGDIDLIHREGWMAAAMLFNTRLLEVGRTIEHVRDEAQKTQQPVRFHIYRAGEYIPCWLNLLTGKSGEAYLMVTIEVPDWTAMSELMDKFLQEIQSSVDSTRGHADLITQVLKRQKPGETVEQVARRIGGFTRIIATNMHRVGSLVELMERMESVRTGRVRSDTQSNSRKLNLEDFFEDFLEELDEHNLLDPETDEQDYRSRIKLDVGADLAVQASRIHLERVLRDLLRNAIMYSMRATPVTITARKKSANVQFDVVDEGYGIRSSQIGRVFLPFQRAQQPQIISEFGYGLSLYLCKHEIEAMNGHLWFKSEEEQGSTFSFTLPAWRADNATSTTTAPDSTASSAAPTP